MPGDSACSGYQGIGKNRPLRKTQHGLSNEEICNLCNWKCSWGKHLTMTHRCLQEPRILCPILSVSHVRAPPGGRDGLCHLKLSRMEFCFVRERERNNGIDTQLQLLLKYSFISPLKQNWTAKGISHQSRFWKERGSMTSILLTFICVLDRDSGDVAALRG